MNEMQRRPGASEVVLELGASQAPRRASAPRVAIGLAILMGGAAIGWAATTVFTPPRDVLDSTSFTYVEVVTGEVGASINLNTVAEWAPVPVGSNLAQGVVTSVSVAPGQEVSAGAVLYSVNLRPVVVAQGDVPAFRALSSGSSGADVSQLQSFLGTLGYYAGTADGRFGNATTRAVKAWQRAMGYPTDGIVSSSDIIYIPSLPTRVSLDTDVIARGASVSGGEEVVRALPAEPAFTVPVTSSQASQMPLGTRVEITSPDGDAWEGFVVSQEPSEDQTAVVVTLEGQDGGSICGEGCELIPVTEESLLRSRIITVETQVGLIVPTAALRSDADGDLSVVDDSGEAHSVEVVTSAKGLALITGVSEGTMVRIPADSE